MKTYAEKKGKKKFDWFEFLKRKDISQKEWEEAGKRAGDWVTCACGNQCSVIPRNSEGVPEDEKLSILGGNFYWAIVQRNEPKAISILKDIEKRSAALIKQAVKDAKKLLAETEG